MYWDAMWDNVKLFSLMWRKNKIISNFVKGLVSDKFFQKFQFIKNNKTDEISSQLFTKKYAKFWVNHDDILFAKSFKSSPVYTNKIWVFNYQHWVVVKLFLFFSTKKRPKVLTDKNNLKKKFLNKKNCYYDLKNYYNLKRFDYIIANILKKKNDQIQNLNTIKIKYF